jgi:predicted nucleic acid-binding protein
MSNKIYIDANVILDYCLDRNEKTNAKLILEEINKGNLRGFMSGSIIHILSYFLEKIYGVEKTKEIILAIVEDFEVIDMPKELIVQALHSEMNDIEDALQYYVALHHKMDYFISNDQQLKSESINTLPVYSTGEFVKLFELS